MTPTFRASEKDRVLTCNGSITLTPMVDPRDGDEGWEGTMLHHLIARRAIAELGAIPPEGGLPPPDVPAGYKLPAFSEWIVDWAIRHLRETVPPDWSLLVEQSFAYQYARYNDSGHADITAISPDATEALGIDWKTGRDPVDPAECNEQVATYLTLYKRAWPTLTKATFQIAQPRADEDEGFQRVSSVTVEDLDALVASMEARTNAAIDNALELNPTPKACKWCIGCSCPALRAELSAMKMKLTPEILATIKRTPDDAALGDFVVTARMLAKPIKDAEEMLHERLDATECVQAGCGTTITRKIQKGAYTVVRPLEFLRNLKSLLPAEESLARVLKPSMTAVKDEIAAVLNVPKTGKAPVTSETIFDASLRPHVEQGERKILQFT